MLTNISRVPEKGKVTVSQSMNASFNGAAYLMERLKGFSIVVSATETSATLAGTLKIQASNNAFTDNFQNAERTDAIWFDITGSSQTVSGTGVLIWNVPDVMYEAVRLVWTRSSGQGTADAYFVAKG